MTPAQAFWMTFLAIVVMFALCGALAWLVGRGNQTPKTEYQEHKHIWTNWTRRQEGTRYGSPRGYSDFFQYRYCKVCNYKQEKTL